MKKKLIFLLLFFSFLGAYCSAKEITGTELTIINKVFALYCEDLKYEKKEMNNLSFEINKDEDNYEIIITDNRFELGGDAYYIVNILTQNIIMKKYGE